MEALKVVIYVRGVEWIWTRPIPSLNTGVDLSTSASVAGAGWIITSLNATYHSAAPSAGTASSGR